MDHSAKHSKLKTLIIGLLIFAFYAIAAKLGLKLAFVNASATAVWAPTGIALAAFLIFGEKFWPGVFAGAFLVNLFTAGSLATSMVIAGGNTLEGLLGSLLVREFANGKKVFERASDILKFILVAELFSTAVSPSVGVTILCLANYAPWGSYADIWITWWLGDLTGALLVTPFLVLWFEHPKVKIRELPGMVLSLILVFLIGEAVFGGWFFSVSQDMHLETLCIPPLIWIAFRFGLRETATASILLCGVSLWNTLHGNGPFVRSSPNQSLLLIQVFMGVVSMTSLALAAAIAEREAAEENLARAQKAEKEVENTNSFISAVLENIPNMIFVKEPKEFRFVLFNKAGEDLVGVSREKMIGKNSYDFFPQDQSDFFTSMDKKVMAEGKMADIPEEPIQTLDKGTRILHTKKIPMFNEDGSPRFLLGISEDITEQMKTEQELIKQTQLMESIIDNMGEGLLVCDAEGKTILVNPAAIFLLEGQIGDPLPGENAPKNMVYKADGKTVLTPNEFPITQAIFGEGSDNVELYVKNSRKPGGIYLLVTSRPVRDRKGKIIGGVSVFRDITERKKMEDLLRSNTELQQFANVASHDLQEPLRMVASYVQLLEEHLKGKLDEDGKEYMGFAVDGAKRMQLLVNGLLEYSRVESQAKAPQLVDMNQILNQTLKNMEIRISETRAVITHTTLPQVMGDPVQLTQLMQNLFSNALKFQKSEMPEIDFSARELDNEWVFSCKDNGIGIDPKYFDRIFVIFQRLHHRNEYSGTGIGLAICKRIVERHGGKLWVESQPHRGTTFFFSLPKRG
jgi:PAS domain S-box-containing protein